MPASRRRRGASAPRRASHLPAPWSARGMRRRRDLCARSVGGEAGIRGAARAPAPRTGVGRHRRLGWDAAHPAQAAGPGRPGLRRRDPGQHGAGSARRRRRGTRRPHRHRPHPLQHHRLEQPAERAAGVRAERAGRADVGPQREPDQCHLAARRAHRTGRRVRDGERHGGIGTPDRPRPRPDLGTACGACLSPCCRRLYLHHAHRARADRRARPGRLPTVGPGAAQRR